MDAFGSSSPVVVETAAQVINVSDTAAIASRPTVFAFPKNENHEEDGKENSLKQQVFEKIRHVTCKQVGSPSNSQTLWRYLDRSEVAKCS